MVTCFAGPCTGPVFWPRDHIPWDSGIPGLHDIICMRCGHHGALPTVCAGSDHHGTRRDEMQPRWESTVSPRDSTVLFVRDPTAVVLPGTGFSHDGTQRYCLYGIRLPRTLDDTVCYWMRASTFFSGTVFCDHDVGTTCFVVSGQTRWCRIPLSNTGVSCTLNRAHHYRSREAITRASPSRPRRSWCACPQK